MKFSSGLYGSARQPAHSLAFVEPRLTVMLHLGHDGMARSRPRALGLPEGVAIYSCIFSRWGG